MGQMKSLLIDQLDDDAEFQLIFESEPEQPNETEAFAFTPTTENHRSQDHAQSLPF